MKREYKAEESTSSTKTKLMDAAEDELLAALGYKVRSSDMAGVAHKLEQLEKALGSGLEDGISHLASDAVHYNPSDLANWLDNMLVELNGPDLSLHYDPQSSAVHFSTQLYDDSDSDLRAIPGEIAFGDGTNTTGTNKKMKKLDRKDLAEASRPVVLVESQETGIRLVHTLMACAEAVQAENNEAAEALVKQIGVLATSLPGAMRKVGTYFAEALARRIYRYAPAEPLNSLSDDLQMHFYDSCPYLKFAHFTANQAILEAFSGRSRVHVVDFSMKQGMQWPALMQALAVRSGGPPELRLTGIALPPQDGGDSLQEVGLKLAQMAETIGVKFKFRGVVASSLEDLEAEMAAIRRREADSEAVAVNSVFELHRLLSRPGAIERVLSSIKAAGPVIVTVVEQEADHNGPVFLDRFTEALHYYSTMFDSLEGTEGQDQVMSEMYLGTQICNVVACEGEERVERHEKLARWQARMGAAGFEPVHLGSNAFKQASMLLALFGGGDGYRVEERAGCLTLGWYTRPLISTSAWQILQRLAPR
ncbi:hypothetical protein AAC387_Pa02g4938 [Persea americana]